MAKFNPGDKAFIVESNRTIREVTAGRHGGGLYLVPKESTKPFVDAVHKAISEYSANIQQPQATVIQQASPGVGVADELMKLKQLLDMGVISEEDFQKQKEKLLG